MENFKYKGLDTGPPTGGEIVVIIIIAIPVGIILLLISCACIGSVGELILDSIRGLRKPSREPAYVELGDISGRSDHIV